jgi:peptide/nickel transport system ATP-binding protein
MTSQIAAPEPLLEIDALSVEIASRRETIAAVRDVSFSVAPGEILGVVGESGSGKSVTALAVMGILPPAARISGGRIRFAGRALDLAGRKRRDRDGLAIIFQNARSALDPVRPVGRQLVDALRVHSSLSARKAGARAVELLDQVRIREPQRRFWSYPFELSGGMCQRVMIAIALACEPRLLIADEPTTGLDVTTQKAIVDLMVALAADRGMATVLITHDLALAGERCARLAVMQGGRVVESGATADILGRPRELYTRSLIAATPRSSDDAQPVGGGTGTNPDPGPLLAVEGLCRDYRLRNRGGLAARAWARLSRRPGAARSGEILRAVDSVTFYLSAGESVGLVGESGSGKSTLAALIVRLIDPTSGRILFRGDDIGLIPARQAARAPYRRDIQMVFQDPTASLNPRHTAFAAIAEPIRRLGPLARDRPLAKVVHELAEMTGFPTQLLGRLPHQLSGGEKARVGIARAIALRPSLLVLDEPTASLDVRVQAVILDLLAKLREEFGMTYLFVSHDLAVVRRICERVLVLRAGRIVESGTAQQVLTAPHHPYTQELVAAIPRAWPADQSSLPALEHIKTASHPPTAASRIL